MIEINEVSTSKGSNRTSQNQETNTKHGLKLRYTQFLMVENALLVSYWTSFLLDISALLFSVTFYESSFFHQLSFTCSWMCLDIAVKLSIAFSLT